MEGQKYVGQKKLSKNLTAGFILSNIQANAPVSHEIERRHPVQRHYSYPNNVSNWFELLSEIFDTKMGLIKPSSSPRRRIRLSVAC